MKYLLSIFLLFISVQNLPAQEIGQWYAYPSLRTVNDITVDGNNHIWGVTNGGIFKFNDGIVALSTLDGLSYQQGNVIAYDAPENQIFAGYADGKIDVINPESNEITTIEDISRAASYTSKRINDLLVYEGRLYAATDFGIVVINTENLLVEESFIKLGSINRASPVLAIDIQDDIIYAGTESGAAFGNLNDELAIQDSWTSFNESNGFISQQVLAIAYWNGNILASSSDSNYIFQNDAWSINTLFEDEVIIDYEFINDMHYAAISDKNFFYSESGTAFERFTLGSEVGWSLSQRSDDTYLYFGTLNGGYGRFDFDQKWLDFQTPEGPFLNIFDGITIAGDGTLISGSTNSSSRSNLLDESRGYYIYEDGTWKNFNKHTNNVLRSADFKLTFTTAETEEYYYIGSWGQGVARHEKETDEIMVFNETNSILRGYVDDNPNYPVISGIGVDRNDDVWLVSRFGTDPLYYQQPGESEWINFPTHNAASSDYYFKLFLDSNDQKWITLQNSSAAGQGVLVLNTGDPLDKNDDTGVKLTTNENSGNLPDAQVKAIIEDRNGEIWVGTQRGIARFIFPEFIIEGTANERRAQWLINEDTTAASRFLLRDVNVSAMAVNGANEKWIGTENQGIFVVNEEGSRIIKRFTSANSPLYSNSIMDIAIDGRTGEVFVSTDMGLMSYMDVPQAGRMEMSNLKVFPNPFNYSQHNEIIIEGLSENTMIRVLGIDGNVVHESAARGGRVSWDGLDDSGNKLGSGVYFVIANEEGGKGRGKGKVVIVR